LSADVPSASPPAVSPTTASSGACCAALEAQVQSEPSADALLPAEFEPQPVDACLAVAADTDLRVAAAEDPHSAGPASAVPEAMDAPSGQGTSDVIGDEAADWSPVAANVPPLAGLSEACRTAVPSPGAAEGVSASASASSARAAEVEGDDKLIPVATAALVGAIEGENWEEASRLLREGAPCDPNARTTDWGYCLLRAAAEEGARETCKQLILRGADPNTLDPNGMTPLMGCVVGGDFPEIVGLLIEAGADASVKTADGFTALAWATRLNREGAVGVLRTSGATGPETCF